MNKITEITEEERKVQESLGVLPEEYLIDPCRYRTPNISKGTRRCFLCGRCSIKKRDEFYEIILGLTYINICKTCAWLTPQTIREIKKETTIKEAKIK